MRALNQEGDLPTDWVQTFQRDLYFRTLPPCLPITLIVETPAAKTRRIGFSLLELLAVVAIIGVIAAVVIPRFAESSNDSKVTVTVHQIRTIANACILYRVEHGEWPPTGGPHAVPVGMEAYFPERYTLLYTCALGGSYKWWGWGGITGWGSNWSTEDMQAVDAMLDDGNLATGNFRDGGGRFRYEVH